MYQTSLSYKIKDSTYSIDNYTLLKLFFEVWIEDICNNDVYYNEEYDDTFQVEFKHPEDAVVLRLKGIPVEFQNYLEIVD